MAQERQRRHIDRHIDLLTHSLFRSQSIGSYMNRQINLSPPLLAAAILDLPTHLWIPSALRLPCRVCDADNRFKSKMMHNFTQEWILETCLAHISLQVFPGSSSSIVVIARPERPRNVNRSGPRNMCTTSTRARRRGTQELRREVKSRT